MTFVSAELIEKTWRRVGSYNGIEIQRTQKRHQKLQKALTKFVYSRLHEFREDAGGVFIYVFHVIVEAFENAPALLKSISKRQIDFVSEDTDFNAAFSIARATECTPESHALQYAYEALTEADDVALSQHEIDSFLVNLEVVIECLHRACQRR